MVCGTNNSFRDLLSHTPKLLNEIFVEVHIGGGVELFTKMKQISLSLNPE